MIPDEAVEAAAVCVSNFHSPTTTATVYGTYARGQKVWYCETCAKMAESVGLFKREVTK